MAVAELFRSMGDADIAEKTLSDQIGFSDETWVSAAQYERAKILSLTGGE